MHTPHNCFLPPPANKRNPWAVRPGLMLNGAGQCTETFHAMQAMQGPAQKPALIALYEGIAGGIYRQNPDILQAATLFPGVVLQIGLQLPLFSREGLLALASGAWEAEAVRMAHTYRQIPSPILLRVGYEFDGVKWNGYDPDAYILAYRYIAEILTREGAANVALVWDSYTLDTENVMDWYPGDDVVDWVGYNTLAPRFEDHNPMANFAHEKGMPLMNGEASYAEGAQSMPFETWIGQYFASLRKARVSAFQYINWRWQVYPQAAGWDKWADGRITDVPACADAYRAAMQGGDMVYRDERYAQPLLLTIDCARALTETTTEKPWNPACDHSTAEPGYTYDATGCTALYGNGWATGWRCPGTCTVTLRIPKPFTGACLLRPLANSPIHWKINGTPYSWTPGHGYLHVPVSGKNTLTLTIENADGGDVMISHIFLLQYADLPALAPRLQSDSITWQPAKDATHYHIFRDGTLVQITDKATCAVPAEAHRWAVAPYHPEKGIGPITEVPA